MREIKFRAWNTRLQEMEYIDDLYWFEENYCSQNGNNDFILMQHTGLKDSKGNPVYEGDILDSHMGPLEVMFVDGAFIAKMKEQPGKWGYHIDGYYFNQVPVIGNLYQNSELLNEPQNENI